MSFRRFQREQDNDIHDGRRLDWVPSRPRRLMGIFRCYGWGPGCSAGPVSFRRQPSEPSVSNAHDQQSKISGQEAERVKEPEVPQRKPPSNLSVRQTASRFHPFFALTSGLFCAVTSNYTNKDYARWQIQFDFGRVAYVFFNTELLLAQINGIFFTKQDVLKSHRFYISPLMETQSRHLWSLIKRRSVFFRDRC